MPPPTAQASSGPTTVCSSAHGTGSTSEGGEPTCSIPAPLLADDEIRSLALAVALKCADLGNLAAPPEVNRCWVQHLEEEYFRQGDRERASEMPVSALMDRAKAGVSKSQTGFFGVVGLPLFRSFVKVRGCGGVVLCLCLWGGCLFFLVLASFSCVGAAGCNVSGGFARCPECQDAAYVGC